MKKVILLLMCIFLLTGCTVNYSLDINDNSIKESASLKISKETLGSEGLAIIKENKDKLTKDGVPYYKKQVTEGFNDVTIKYTHNYEDLDISSSKFLNQCFRSGKSTIENGVLIIETQAPFQCYNKYGTEKITEATIVINTKLNVLENNADEVNGNKYIWNITADNYYEKTILIKMSMPKGNGYLLNDNKTIIMVGISIIVIIFIGIIYMLIRSKKNNKI